MKNQIVANGDIYRVAEIGTNHPTLPIGVYTLMFSPFSGYYLQKQGDQFDLPTKIYNRPTKTIERWLKAWNNTTKNLGVFLVGQKGSGKTITAQDFANVMRAPVICITEAYNDEGFKQFLSDPIFNGSIVFIDEFEKVYRHQDQEDNSIIPLLGFLDGAYNTHLCFVLTSNSENISEFLVNRPGRIKYRVKYDYMTPKDAIEVVQDRLKDMSKEESVYKMLDQYGNCTMDILTKVIDDMNLFDEDALTCAKYMNLVADRLDLATSFVLNMWPEKEFQCYPMYSVNLEDGMYGHIRVPLEVQDEINKFIYDRKLHSHHKMFKGPENVKCVSSQISMHYDLEDLTRLDNGTYTVENHTVAYLGEDSLQATLFFKPEGRFSKARSQYVL